jgi:Tfp pilus assembly protein PilF
MQQGQEYLQAGKYQEALIMLKKALQLEPTLAQAHYHLDLAYLKTGLIVDGFAALDQSVRLDPHLTAAQLELGKLYLLAQDLTKARAKAQLVLEQEPEKIQGHLLLGEIAAERGGLQKRLQQSTRLCDMTRIVSSRSSRLPGSIV